MSCQLRLLLWKNLLQQRRSLWFTLFEVVVPCFLIFMFLSISLFLLSFKGDKRSATIFEPWEITGHAVDLFVPTKMNDSDEAIIQPKYFANTTDYDDCKFLKVTPLSNNTHRLVTFYCGCFKDACRFSKQCNVFVARPTDAVNSIVNCLLDVHFAYAPKSKITDDIMASVKQQYTAKDVLSKGPKTLKSIYRESQPVVDTVASVTGFENESAMVLHMVDQLNTKCDNPLLAGIVFDESIANKLNTETHLGYKIRLSNALRRVTEGGRPDSWDTSKRFVMEREEGPHKEDDNDGGKPGYWQEGFLTVQRAVDVAIMKQLNVNGSSEHLELVRFPFPEYSTNALTTAATMIPMITTFSYMASVIYIVRSVVIEKEDRLKEYMRVMGLSQFTNWLAHFITNYAKLSVSICILTLFLHNLAPKSSTPLMFLFLMLYAFNVVYIAFLISTFMSSTTAATLLSIIVWVALFVGSLYKDQLVSASTMSFEHRFLHCLNPNTALAVGLDLLATYEVQANGLTMRTVFEPPAPDNPMTFVVVLGALFIDAYILIILTWYVEAVYPGGDGVPQKPWFFIQKSYWFSHSVNDDDSDSEPSVHINQYASHVKIETVIDDSEPFVKIVNLSKVYGASFAKQVLSCGTSAQKTAVNNLNLEIYPNQCTVLLGHNGAGKSTTFSVLTGVAAPTRGTVYVNNNDIRTSLAEIREQMGLCPQYNTLFFFMTVMEHLKFFAKLKGRVWDPEEARQILDRLRIGFKANALSATLSGGQKRKLSLAIALIGGSEIVMLDEPTSGMDPGARHEAWTLLQQEKSRRTIILSTHFMEEADLLGDRIAVLAHGQLECCGSSMYLKKTFGDGYHLTVVYSMQLKPEVHQTTAIIRQFIPDAELYSHVGQEATYLLDAKYRPVFPKLFAELEQNLEKCGISSFGASITTMEEVFLKVNQLAETRYNLENGQEESHEMISKDDPNLKLLRVPNRVSGVCLQLQHMKAMIYKRAIYLYRTWARFLPLFLFPIVYLFLMLWLTSGTWKVEEQDPLTISFALFSKGSRVITNDGLFMSDYLGSAVKNAIDSFKFNQIYFGDVEQLIMNLTTKEGPRMFGARSPIAVSTNSSQPHTLRAYFNNFCYFTPALAVSFADSLILSQSTNKSYTITVTNHPLPPPSQETVGKTEANPLFLFHGMSVGFAVIVGAFSVFLIMERPLFLFHGMSVGFAVIVGAFSVFLIMERKKKAKHMQLLSGIRPYMFWLCTFLWDYMLFLLEVVFFVALFYLFDVKQFTHDTTIMSGVVLSMLAFGWAAIPATYFFQFFFTSGAKCFAMVTMHLILTQLFGFIAIALMRVVSLGNEPYTPSFYLSILSPTFCLTHIGNLVFMNEARKTACQAMDCTKPQLAFHPCCRSGPHRSYVDNILLVGGERGAQTFLKLLIVQGIFFWTLVLLKDGGLFAWIVGKIRKNKMAKEPERTAEERGVEEDSDVLAEKALVETLKDKESAVVVCDNLMKRYGKLNAVKGVNFHVYTNNCFGLLGVNGAGKTSTFQMLTGENRITCGDAYIDGWSVKNNWRKAGEHIGYCPQYDAIIKELSGEETLYMYARIRGIPESEIETNVNAVIHSIGIGMYAKEPIVTYSGGNKRRLSLGIALIGLPSVLLLDEPTSGVDPKARRIVWNILNQVRDLGTALVLTSHSMNECEALCTELAIMINGKFRCYGSCQHIKSRYGSGYTLLIKLKENSAADRTKEEIERVFQGSKLVEEHVYQLNYDVPRGTYTWSQLFEQLETVSQQLDWDDYSLSQTTLEQVFVEFSRIAAAPSS